MPHAKSGIDVRLRDDSENRLYIWTESPGKKPSSEGGPFALDETKQPKRFVVRTGDDKELAGIYMLSGDRLTIAYCRGDKPPEKFESKPGSGVTLLVLQKFDPSKPPAPAAENAPPTVTVSHPLVRKITDHQDFTGRIEPIQTAEVRPRVTSRLVKVHFQPGATVKQGDLLVKLDPQPFLAQMKKEALDYELAKVRLAQSERELSLAKDANAKTPGAVSSRDIGALASKRAEAELVLQAAKLSQDAAKSRVEATQVTAPVGGKISQIAPLTVDMLVAADSKEPLATIVSLDSVYVCFAVDQHAVLQLRRKMQETQAKGGPNAPFTVACRVVGDASQDFPYRGEVESADVPVTPETGTAQWRAKLSNKDGTLLPGMFASVRLMTSAPHDAMLIPERAIKTVGMNLQTGRNHNVFVVKEVGKRREAGEVIADTKSFVVEERSIGIGRQENDMRVVTDGLTENDRVVLSSTRELQPGMTVKPQNADSPTSIPPASPQNEKTIRDSLAQPSAVSPATEAKVPPVVLRVNEQPNGPWVGRLPDGMTVELLAIGENDRWWQPNGAPLAAPPCALQEAPPKFPEADFTRRAFIARISGLPLSRSGMNFEVQPSSGTDDSIAYQDIQKVPTRSYFSGMETSVPISAKTVTLRWGISIGGWQEAALAVPDLEGRLIGPGSWGERLNSLRVLGTQNGTELELPYQPQYEERAIAILHNNGYMKADFTRFQDRVRAMFASSRLASDFREIKLQRRPYAWVEFHGVPAQWSDTPIRSASALPNTCNVTAQAKGPWVARLSNGVSVELVGVNDEDRWWQPNGSPLAEPPCQINTKGVCDDASLVRRRFFLRLNGLPSLPAGIVGNVAPGVAPVTLATVPEQVRQAGKMVYNRVNFLAFEAFVPPASRTITTVTCGVATGPWKDFTSPSVNVYKDYISGGVSCGSYNVNLHIQKNKDGVTAGVSVDRLEKDDLRLVLITYDGRALTGRARIDHPKKQQTQTTITATFPGLTLQEIKAVNVERRPYEWVCFSYVAAAPGGVTKLEPVAPRHATPPAKKP